MLHERLDGNQHRIEPNDQRHSYRILLSITRLSRRLCSKGRLQGKGNKEGIPKLLRIRASYSRARKGIGCHDAQTTGRCPRTPDKVGCMRLGSWPEGIFNPYSCACALLRPRCEKYVKIRRLQLYSSAWSRQYTISPSCPSREVRTLEEVHDQAFHSDSKDSGWQVLPIEECSACG